MPFDSDDDDDYIITEDGLLMVFLHFLSMWRTELSNTYTSDQRLYSLIAPAFDTREYLKKS